MGSHKNANNRHPVSDATDNSPSGAHDTKCGNTSGRPGNSQVQQPGHGDESRLQQEGEKWGKQDTISVRLGYLVYYNIAPEGKC